jgi:hypothetical protein
VDKRQARKRSGILTKQNFRIKIRDSLFESNILNFDLKEVLQTISSLTGNLSWTVHDVSDYGENLEITGPASAAFESTRDLHGSLTNKELVELASKTEQCIWAEFQGRESRTKNECSLIIRAIDSSFWEVESENLEVLLLLEKRFENTELVKAHR